VCAFGAPNSTVFNRLVSPSSAKKVSAKDEECRQLEMETEKLNGSIEELEGKLAAKSGSKFMTRKEFKESVPRVRAVWRRGAHGDVF
jgi:hypothetical protein